MRLHNPALLLLSMLMLLTTAHAASSTRAGYIGVVTKSDSHAGKQFTFANLRTKTPFVTFPSGNGSQTTKVFEDDELIVLVFVSNLSGSTEMFYLNTRSNRFTLIEVSALEATVKNTDFKPSITYGTLQ